MRDKLVESLLASLRSRKFTRGEQFDQRAAVALAIDHYTDNLDGMYQDPWYIQVWFQNSLPELEEDDDY